MRLISILKEKQLCFLTLVLIPSIMNVSMHRIIQNRNLQFPSKLSEISVSSPELSPEFVLSSSKIDYALIRHGLDKSKELSQRLNMLGAKKENSPCKCSNEAIFCECDEMVINDNLEESPPIVLPLIQPVIKKNY